jgi:hypothetical protein
MEYCVELRPQREKVSHVIETSTTLSSYFQNLTSDLADLLVVATLKGGHEPGSKIRNIWCGMVMNIFKGKQEEWVISGGFDRRLVIWKPAVED